MTDKACVSAIDNAASKAASKTWEWDGAGNPDLDKQGNWVNFDDNTVADIRQHNTTNEIAAVGDERTYGGTAREVAYDDAGNLITLVENDGSETWTFTYDYRNRVVTASDGTTTTTYYYDAGNRRVKKDLETGTDVMYSYDGWQCIEEREYDGGDAAWELRRQYVYGSQYIDEPVLFDSDTDTDGVMDASYWYLQDTNYNVVALTKASGATIERCWFKPYGTTTFTDDDGDTPANQSVNANTLAFAVTVGFWNWFEETLVDKEWPIISW